MKIKDITGFLETLAPLSYQESYDNSGLIVGDPNWEVKGVLVSLDCLESIIDEAIAKGCNLIVAHHPIVFSGLKKLNGNNYIERTVIKAIKHDIGIYAIHTNLDNVALGVNKRIADKLGLENTEILAPKSDVLKKLEVYAPSSNLAELKKALFSIGAGEDSKYKDCSYVGKGEESFTPSLNANPFLGEKEKAFQGAANKLEMVFPAFLESRVKKIILEVHPYEVPAFNIFKMTNEHSGVGSGMIGTLANPIKEMEFLNLLKEKFKAKGIRYTSLRDRAVKKIAVCGGSGSFLLRNAIRAGADFLVTADFKYHQFFDAEDRIVIADIGHFESEQYTIDLIGELLLEKFPKFALYLSDVNTNPINYL